MPKMRKTGLGGGLSARYGTAPRRRYIGILTRMRRLHECPQCQARAAKRISIGIWGCRKCGFQFTGGAYVPFTKIGDAAKRSASSAASQKLAAQISAITASESAGAEAEKPKRRRRKTKTEEPPKEDTQ